MPRKCQKLNFTGEVIFGFTAYIVFNIDKNHSELLIYLYLLKNIKEIFSFPVFPQKMLIQVISKNLNKSFNDTVYFLQTSVDVIKLIKDMFNAVNHHKNFDNPLSIQTLFLADAAIFVL